MGVREELDYSRERILQSRISTIERANALLADELAKERATKSLLVEQVVKAANDLIAALEELDK